MKGIFFLGFLALFSVGVACSNAQNEGQGESGLKIVGGEAATANDYPSVIKMTVDPGTATTPAKICTGVIVSHRTVLAAAHCIKQKTSGQNLYHFVEIEAGSTRTKVATKASYAYTYNEPLGQDSIPDNHVALDLAVMDFGQNAFSLAVYPKISLVTPKNGEAVTLVGFGATAFNQAEAKVGELNFGKNTISEANPADGYIKVSGQIGANGIPSGALAAPGDSGGPLFNTAGELIGIGSGLLINGGKIVNYYVDLTNRETKILVGRYLQEFGGTTGKLVPGFSSELGNEFSTVVPRTSTSNLNLIAMCGGKAKDKDKVKELGDGPSVSGSISAGTDNLSSQFGSGNVGAVPGLGNNASSTSPTSQTIPIGGNKSDQADETDELTSEIGAEEDLKSGTIVITP